MRFGVLGAGAIGGLIGARLAAAGQPVALVARGAHLERIRTVGLRVVEPDGSELTVHPPCADDLAILEEADCVLVTLKAHALGGVAERLGALGRGRSTLVFAQNGLPWWYRDADGRPLESLDPGGVLAEQVAVSRVVACIAYPSASLPEPGLVLHSEGNRLTLGEPGGARTPRLRKIAAALAAAGFKAPITAHLMADIWVKLLFNASLNPVSALGQATVARILGDDRGRALIRALMSEVGEVAEASGTRLPMTVEDRLALAERAREHRTSMLQDLESGRRLEAEALVGAVIELGDRLGVSLPHLRTVYACLRLLDTRRTGC